MQSTPRYEILNSIASGDFATVYRARDRELGREVAVKQIHQQFLSNPRQTERYWREAQLLASLQHPNILTIYDIVRPRGWLILELMRGNLGQSIQAGPLDLDFLRVALPPRPATPRSGHGSRAPPRARAPGWRRLRGPSRPTCRAGSSRSPGSLRVPARRCWRR